MTIYLLKNDRMRVRADTPTQLIRYMAASSRSPVQSLEEYMVEVSDRTILQSGGKIRVDSPDHFVEDLLSEGLISVYEK